MAWSTNVFASAIQLHIGSGYDIYQIISGDAVQRFDEGDNGIDEEDEVADLYHFAELVAALGEPDLTTAASNLMLAIDRYITYTNAYTGTIWDHSNAHGLSILLTDKLACYYTSPWFDFAGDVSWFCNPGLQAIDQEPGDWGQMLSDYIWEFDSNPEQQLKPPPLVPLDIPLFRVYIPIVMKGW